MEPLSCPPVADQELPTLKEWAMSIAQADHEGTLDEGPESFEGISLEELKLETDSMMAITSFLVSRGVGDDEKFQQGLADFLTTAEAESEHETLLQAFREEADTFIGAIFLAKFQQLQDNGRNDILFRRLDRYRQAYYERSPAAEDSEKHYESIESLIVTGVNTATHHIPHLLHSLDMKMTINHLARPGQPVMTRDEKVELARQSDHLAIWLAKTDIEGLDNYIELLNGEESIGAVLVEITSDNKGYHAMINPRILQLIYSAAQKDEAKYDHRPQLGCPGAVAFPAFTSAVTEAWRLSVGALEKAGHWD